VIKAQIVDGSGSDRAADVTKHRALKVTQEIPPVPTPGTMNRYRYFNGKLGSTGLDSGVVNMNVNGSGTAQEFFVGADQNFDIHIMHIAILFSDNPSVAHNDFGSVNELSTGWDLKIREQGVETFIVEKAQTGGQVIAQGGFTWGFGNDATSWELTNWTGNEDAQIIAIPIGDWIPGGLRLGIGSNDKLISVVNDNLTGLVEMFVKVFGYKHFP
jgi:hypothetical protein